MPTTTWQTSWLSHAMRDLEPEDSIADRSGCLTPTSVISGIDSREPAVGWKAYRLRSGNVTAVHESVVRDNAQTCAAPLQREVTQRVRDDADVTKSALPMLQPLQDVTYTTQQLSVAASLQCSSGNMWTVGQSAGTLTFCFRGNVCLIAHCKATACAVLWNPQAINISSKEALELFRLVMKVYVLQDTSSLCVEQCTPRLLSLLQTTHLDSWSSHKLRSRFAM